MDQAREKIKAALKKNNKVFYSSWNDFSMGPEERIKYIIEQYKMNKIEVKLSNMSSRCKELFLKVDSNINLDVLSKV